MAFNQQGGPIMAMPMPQDFQAPFMAQQSYHQYAPSQEQFGQPSFNYYHARTSSRAVQPTRQHAQRHSQQYPAYQPYAQHQQHFQQSPQFAPPLPPNAVASLTSAPPLPAKEPLNVRTSWPLGNAMDDATPPPPPPRPVTPAIEPDPLPPHSNPQKLSPTQSAAFEGPAPIPPVKIGKDSVSDANGSSSLFTITREAVHTPFFLSTKPLLTLTRTANGMPIGTIKFRALDNSSCEVNLAGGLGQTRLKEDGWIHFRWVMKPSSNSSADGRAWYFKKSKPDIVLEDAKKHGNVIARLSGDVLEFEKGGLSQTELDEIVLGFVALAEAARRSGKVITELATSIGDMSTSIDGSSGGAGIS